MKPIITAKDLIFIAAFALLVLGLLIGMMVLAVIGGVIATGTLFLTATMMYRRQAAARRRAEEKRKNQQTSLHRE